MLKVKVIATALACISLAALALGDQVFMHRYGSGDIIMYDTNAASLTVVGGTSLNGFCALAAAPIAVPKAGGGTWPAGTLFGLDRDSGSLYVIDKTDASLTLVGSDPGYLAGSQGLSFSSTGQLFSLRDDTNDGEISQVSTETGAGTYLGYCDVYDLDDLTVFPSDMSVAGFGTAHAGDFLACNGGELWHIDPGTFVATYLGNSTAQQTLEFSPDGTLYDHDWSGGNLYTTSLDPLGDTFIASVGDNVDGMAVVIPEPMTALLFGIGALALVSRRR